MTEYTEKVEKQRLKNAAEEWGNKIAYIHFNNGIEETKYNNGRIIQKNINNCVFVGRDMKTLFITIAITGIDAESRNESSLFVVELPVKGMEYHKFL